MKHLLILCLLAGQAYAANLIAKANANWTTNTTWGVVEAGASATQTTKTSSTNTTTSYVYSSAFTCTNTDVVDGLLLHVVRVNTTGTVSVALSDDNGVTATRAVTVNASDLPTAAAWVFFKFGSTLTCDGGVDYKVGVTASSAGNATFYRDGTAGNWARLLRTTADQTPIAADNLYIAGEWTAAATVTARTVTMNETATTDYGTLDIGQQGSLTYGTTAATNYYLRLSGDLNIWSGGTLNIGSVGAAIPSDSTAKLNLDSGSNVQYGIIVNNGGNFVIRGATKTVSAFLAANASSGATSITSNTSTGWLSGDEIGIASTTQTATETEKKTMSGAATGTTIPIAALTSTHSGTSPTQAELINLTRNVQIFGASSSLQTYVYVSATATIDWDYGEFYWMGSNTSTKYGVHVDTTTGSFTMNHTSLHDFVVSGSRGIYVASLTSGVFSVSNSVFYNMQLGAIDMRAVSNTSWVITGNIAMGRSDLSYHMFYLGDAGGTVTNNTAVGSVGTNTSGFLFADTGAMGTFSGNIAHSNQGTGITFISTPTGNFGITNCVSWRNGQNGFNYQANSLYSTTTLTIDGLTAFGNGSGYNIIINNAAILNLVLNNLVLSGDSTFSTTYGLNLSGSYTGISLYNSTFGVASGIKVAHSGSDIYINAAGGITVSGNNVTLASTNPITSNGSTTIVQVGIDGYGQVAGTNQSFTGIGGNLYTITSTDSAIYKAAAPSQRIKPATASYKAKSSAKTVAVASGATTTISAWVRKSISSDSGGANYNGSQPRLIVQRNPICGIGTGTADVTLATMTAAVGTWEQLSGTTSAVSADCVLTAYVDLDGTAGWVNVDDWAATNSQSIGSEKYWTSGTTNLTVGGSGSSGSGTTCLMIRSNDLSCYTGSAWIPVISLSGK